MRNDHVTIIYLIGYVAESHEINFQKSAYEFQYLVYKIT